MIGAVLIGLGVTGLIFAVCAVWAAVAVEIYARWGNDHMRR